MSDIADFMKKIVCIICRVIDRLQEINWNVSSYDTCFAHQETREERPILVLRVDSLRKIAYRIDVGIACPMRGHLKMFFQLSSYVFVSAIQGHDKGSAPTERYTWTDTPWSRDLWKKLWYQWIFVRLRYCTKRLCASLSFNTSHW